MVPKHVVTASQVRCKKCGSSVGSGYQERNGLDRTVKVESSMAVKLKDEEGVVEEDNERKEEKKNN